VLNPRAQGFFDMNASTTRSSRSLDPQILAAGILLPMACIIVDFAAGEYVLQSATAGLLTLALIGMTVLLLSAIRRLPAFGLLVIGPMWSVGLLTSILAAVLALVSVVGLFGVPILLVISPMFGALVFAWALLGLTPAWTGFAYVRRAYLLTRDHAEPGSRGRIVMTSLIGALLTVAAIAGAHALETRWIDARLRALDGNTLRVWPATLASLNSYPLCGRQRCLRKVCGRFFEQFGETPPGGLATSPNVPVEHGRLFQEAFGVPVKEACQRTD
jgi:hypothetical protein